MEKLISEARCENCKFARGFQKGPNLKGTACKRFPPTFIAIAAPRGVMEVIKFPEVQPEDWCGEHVPRFMQTPLQ